MVLVESEKSVICSSDDAYLYLHSGVSAHRAEIGDDEFSFVFGPRHCVWALMDLTC